MQLRSGRRIAMRCGGLILLLVMPLLVGCKLLPPASDEPPPAGISAPTPSDDDASTAGIRPKPRPASILQNAGDAATPAPERPPTEPALAEVPPEPTVQKSRQQALCEKTGGSWVNAGETSLKTCVKRTRDAGKQCRKQTDCSSACLARSGTCAPVKPLLGCNEILQKDGSRVMLCLD